MKLMLLLVIGFAHLGVTSVAVHDPEPKPAAYCVESGLILFDPESDVEVLITPFPSDLPVGEQFALTLVACDPARAILDVDATMPAHDHGMNYRPTLTLTEPGRYRVEGMLFHMAGAWRIAVTSEGPQGPVELSAEIDVGP